MLLYCGKLTMFYIHNCIKFIMHILIEKTVSDSLAILHDYTPSCPRLFCVSKSILNEFLAESPMNL